MRVSLTHRTVYRYPVAVNLEPHTFRLRPREDGAQRLIRHALSIAPAPAGRSECLDQEGNVVVEAWFDAPVEKLAVESAFTMETLRENPYDFLLRAGTSLPVEYSPAMRAALGPYLHGPAPAVCNFASSFGGRGTYTLDFLGALNQALSREFRYVARDTGAPNPAADTLRAREGSCRDLAVLFCDAARAAGIAARFVSGYQCPPACGEKIQMHAWAEVYLEGGGWRGYDPSAGLAVTTGHIAVAASADPRLAAPVTGAFRGAAEAAMEFKIEMSAAEG